MPTAPLAAAVLVASLAVPIAARADDGPPGLAPPPTPAPTAAPALDDDPCGGGHATWQRWHHRRPRLALGFAKSHVETRGDGAGEREGSQQSLLGRVVLRRGFEVELELARGELAGEATRTAGGALLRTFGHRRLAPYVIAGGGGGRIDRADGTEPRLHFGEVGGGLMLRKRRLAIGVDFRAGVRRVEDADADRGTTAAARTAAPAPVPEPADRDDRERYVRGRVVALIYF